MANSAIIGALFLIAIASISGGIWKWLRSPRRLYLKRLRKLLEEMPFIYRGDLPTTVLDDYVDAEYEVVSLPGTAKGRSNRSKSLHEAIREHRRVLILGDAGMGKTTFVRFSLLQLIDNPEAATFIRDPRLHLPVFIPLKAIDNSEKYPIFRYITSNISYFSGQKGLARFKQMAAQGRLLLCLDGYDEIPLAASARNYIREELNEIFSTPPYRASEVASLSLINCAIWLSSRQVFFYANPIEGITPSSDVLAIKLVGVGERRLRIIKNIFKRYESGQHISEGLLDPEYFLGQIDSSAGEDVVTLSHNPLFLTVLCYIYATQAIAHGTHEIETVNNINDLIIVCVDLLISDLDENKARDLTPARRAALLRRRNAYTKEKRDFLRYFAFILMVRAVATFDLEYIKTAVCEYFTVVARSDKSTLIISELSRDVQTNPHFALQLVYCGVFAIASMDDSRTAYDFAHRRFREVLGSEYLNTPERYLELLKMSDSPALSEFLRVFRRSAHWQDGGLHEGALKLILARCISDRSEGLVVASNGLVTEKPLGLDVSKHIELFLLTILQVDQPRFRLGVWMLWLCPEVSEIIESAERSLIHAWRTKDELRAILAFRILWRFRRSCAGITLSGIDEIFWPKVICALIGQLVLAGASEPPNSSLEHASLVSLLDGLPEQTRNRIFIRSSFAGGVDLDWIARQIETPVNSTVIEALLARKQSGADFAEHCRELSGKLIIGKDAFQKLERWLKRGMLSSYAFIQSYESVLNLHGIPLPQESLIATDESAPLRKATLPLSNDVDHFVRFARELDRVIVGLRGKVVKREDFDFQISRVVDIALKELVLTLQVDKSRSRGYGPGETPIMRKDLVDLDSLDGGPIDVGSLIAFVQGEIGLVRTTSTWTESELRELLRVVEEERANCDTWCEFFEYNPGTVQISRRKASERAELKQGPRDIAVVRGNVRGEVFISYAWGGESELIVEYLRESLQNRQINVRYDRSEIKYRDSIGDFMNRLGQGRCVVVVVGAAYLKSRNCMFELLSIMHHGNPRGRVFPIVLRDANVFNPLGVLEYVDYWEKKKAELETKLQTMDSQNLQEICSEVEVYAKIGASFSKIAAFLRDTNALSVEEHSASHFEDLIGQVEARLST